jgi:hypothetical protein
MPNVSRWLCLDKIVSFIKVVSGPKLVAGTTRPIRPHDLAKEVRKWQMGDDRGGED